MKIMVVGLGALGTVYACLLSRAGHEVYGLDRELVCDQVTRNGLRVSGIWGEHHAYLQAAAADSDKLKGIAFDLILVTVKSFHTLEAVKNISGLVGENTYVCLLQNGLGNYEAAAVSVPKAKLILGRVIFGAETLDTAVSKVTVIADEVMIGSPDLLVPMPILTDIAAAFSKALIPTKATAKILDYVWAKIIYNSALNPLGTLFEVNYGELAENPKTRELMDKIIAEIFALLKVLKQNTLWPDAETYRHVFYQELIPATAAHHASMLQDFKLGRQTEIEALNGAIAELAAKHGISAPVNQLITDMIKSKEYFTLAPLAR
jgi:2-dehydropantoate 2-reductase